MCNMRLLTGISLVAFGLLAMTKAEDGNVQALRAVVEGINRFSSSFYHTAREVYPGNLVVSPLGVAIPLAMVGYAARGETETQFRNVLHMPSPDSLGTSGYQALIDLLKNSHENKVVLYTKLLVEGNVTVKPSYKELIETYFRSGLQSRELFPPWVKEIHGGPCGDNLKCPCSISSLQWIVSSDTQGLVPFNVMGIEAVWKDIFRVQDTTDMPFYVTKDEVMQTPMMTRTSVYRTGFVEELDAQFILIPYKGDESSMVILLPKEIDGLVEMERKMRNVSLSNALRSGTRREVRLSLPRFQVVDDPMKNFSSVFERMGLVDAVTTQSNFSGAVDYHSTLAHFRQGSRVLVNEEACNAAAATDEVAETGSSATEPSPLVFKVDHPFVFSIVKSFPNPEYSSVDPIVVFTGCVMEPRND